MIEEISKKVEDLFSPIIQDVYDIAMDRKDNDKEEFIKNSLKSLEDEYEDLFIDFKTSLIGNNVLSLQFYFYMGRTIFSKYIMFNNEIYKTVTIDLKDKIEWEKKVVNFLNTYKAEVRQNKIKKILN
jgi:hypothetical protein